LKRHLSRSLYRILKPLLFLGLWGAVGICNREPEFMDPVEKHIRQFFKTLSNKGTVIV